MVAEAVRTPGGGNGCAGGSGGGGHGGNGGNPATGGAGNTPPVSPPQGNPWWITRSTTKL